jgi:hypothetical protein
MPKKEFSAGIDRDDSIKHAWICVGIELQQNPPFATRLGLGHGTLAN